MARKKMDKLSQDVVQCEKDGFGCHYGKWKAMQKPVKIAPKELPKEMPEVWQYCKGCGKAFKLKTRRPQTYCDITCQQRDYYQNNREKILGYSAKYRNKRKEAAMAQK